MVTSRDASSKTKRVRKTISNWQDKLRNDAKIIKILERIGGRRAKLVTEAIQILQHPQAARDAKIYAQFLKDITQHASPGHALLCAASLGKQVVSRLKEIERADIVQFVKENKESLSCKVLTSLAKEYGITTDEQLLNVLHGQDEVPIRAEGESGE